MIGWLVSGGHVDSTFELAVASEGGAAVFCGNTLLMVACAYGRKAFTEQLLRRSASLDLQSSDGGTALMLAASHGHYTIVERLLLAGARVDVKDSEGRTALHWAEADSRHSRDHAAVARLLREVANVDEEALGV